MSLKNKIYELRKHHGMSQEQLAETIGVARQTISKWELGETAPNIGQAQLLSQAFDVSLSELLGDEATELQSNADSATNAMRKTKLKIIIAISIAIILFLTVLFGVCNIVKRSQILHPQGISEVTINNKQSISIGNGNATTIVFNEADKPSISCNLPTSFTQETQKAGTYTDGNDFIRFNAEYTANISNPLTETDYITHYIAHGYSSYMDMARLALRMDLSDVGVFSSEEQVYLVGGARLIRADLCASQNADYYEIDDGLTANSDKMRIYGFALHFDNTVWLITLKDCNDIYYFISIKAPNGVGKSIDTVGALLSTIPIAE